VGRDEFEFLFKLQQKAKSEQMFCQNKPETSLKRDLIRWARRDIFMFLNSKISG